MNSSIEVTGRIVVQDHENKRHKFVLDDKSHRFEDFHHLMEVITENYEKRAWIKNNT